jgi:hypothetical protein
LAIVTVRIALAPGRSDADTEPGSTDMTGGPPVVAVTDAVTGANSPYSSRADTANQ